MAGVDAGLSSRSWRTSLDTGGSIAFDQRDPCDGQPAQQRAHPPLSLQTKPTL
jgi:hypothetical protein